MLNTCKELLSLPDVRDSLRCRIKVSQSSFSVSVGIGELPWCRQKYRHTATSLAGAKAVLGLFEVADCLTVVLQGTANVTRRCQSWPSWSCVVARSSMAFSGNKLRAMWFASRALVKCFCNTSSDCPAASASSSRSKSTEPICPRHWARTLVSACGRRSRLRAIPSLCQVKVAGCGQSHVCVPQVES